MRYIITTTEFEFHERVYIIEAENVDKALAEIYKSDTKPFMDSITRKKVIQPIVELLIDHPSYLLLKKGV